MAQIDHKERITYLLETIVKHLERAKAIASGTEIASIWEFEKSFSLAHNWSQELILHSKTEGIQLTNRICVAVSNLEQVSKVLKGEASRSESLSLSFIEQELLPCAISDFRSGFKSQ
jgi:hypothetical protein